MITPKYKNISNVLLSQTCFWEIINFLMNKFETLVSPNRSGFPSFVGKKPNFTMVESWWISKSKNLLKKDPPTPQHTDYTIDSLTKLLLRCLCFLVFSDLLVGDLAIFCVAHWEKGPLIPPSLFVENSPAYWSIFPQFVRRSLPTLLFLWRGRGSSISSGLKIVLRYRYHVI